MTEHFRELERYVRFGPEDLARLRAFRVKAAPHFARIARDFYERIREHVEAHAVFTGEDQIERLKRSLAAWMERVCTGERDDQYARDTAKIGAVHVHVGLPQRYVFTAMALIHMAFDEIATREMGSEAEATRASIARALYIELAMMLETYHEDNVARVQRLAKLEHEEIGRALARTEHHYINAVELAPYLVVGLDKAGRILLYNHAAERVTGYARDEVLARSFVELFVSDPNLAARANAVIDGKAGGADVFTSALRAKPGQLRTVRWHVAHAPASDEDVVAFAIGSDVSEEASLAERTRQAEKLAAVGTLAAGLAHEIRNPLNGAHLHVTFLERGLRKSNADSEMLDAVHVVADEIQRLSNLVTEFLDFARPKPLHREPVVLQRVCERVAQLVSGQLAPARVSLELDLPSAELVAHVDPARVEQVLLNLVQNAIEAMGSSGGGPCIIRLRRQPVRAILEVEDHGPGLADPSAPIFDAFFSTKPSGTGLGLAIVHRIVSDHGGTITFQSRPGKTVFTIGIPLGS